MSEAKTICPHCLRVPGEQHDKKCPRSQRSMQLRQSAARAPRARLLWCKGITSVKVSRWRPARTLVNPGVPFVKPPKPWYAGGLPGSGGPANASGPVLDFIKQMERIVKDSRA